MSSDQSLWSISQISPQQQTMTLPQLLTSGWLRTNHFYSLMQPFPHRAHSPGHARRRSRVQSTHRPYPLTSRQLEAQELETAVRHLSITIRVVVSNDKAHRRS